MGNEGRAVSRRILLGQTYCCTQQEAKLWRRGDENIPTATSPPPQSSRPLPPLPSPPLALVLSLPLPFFHSLLSPPPPRTPLHRTYTDIAHAK